MDEEQAAAQRLTREDLLAKLEHGEAAQLWQSPLITWTDCTFAPGDDDCGIDYGVPVTYPDRLVFSGCSFIPEG
jgi:hypothetical protein